MTGAVNMVETALMELTAHGSVAFDDERKAVMVNDLMVVLCGESQVTPVVNTGTLFTRARGAQITRPEDVPLTGYA